MGRGARNDQASILGQARSRVARMVRGYQISDPRPEMPAVVAKDHERLRRHSRLLDNGGSSDRDYDRKLYLEDLHNANHAYNDALAAYELMNQLEPNELNAIDAYHSEIDFMLGESRDWLDGRRDESYSENNQPYQVKYGYPGDYKPESLARPDGAAKAQARADEINQANKNVYQGILESNERYAERRAEKGDR